MIGLDVHKIRQSTNRYNLWAGADRQLIQGLLLLAALITFAWMKLTAAVAAIGGFMVCLALLRMIAKVDPLLRQVYLRSLRYRAYMPARASVWRSYVDLD